MKDSKQHDAGVAQTLLDRMSNQRLPRALELKEKVDAGETLSEFDLRFLEEVFADAQSIQPMVERHPEYQQLVSRAIHLYKEILEKAMENEKKS
jgi:phosphotransferase system IIA component